MSILRQKFRSDWRLWWAASLVLFILGGFVNLLPDSIKGSDHFWGHVNRLLYGGHLYNTQELTTTVVFLGMLLAVPALLLGWLLQALLFFTLGVFRGGANHRAT
jgi:hypothetical protein